MNKRFLISIFLVLIIGISGFVVAINWATETTFDFDEGWNLVYGLQSPEQLSGILVESNIKAIYAFIPATQQYLRAWPNPDSKAWEDLDKVMDDHALLQTAFWVYTDKGTAGADGEYWLYDSPNSYTTRQMYKGWNFVGITADMISTNQFDTNLKDIKGNCNIEKSYFWLNEFQKWEELPVEHAQLEENSIGFGWVIKVTDNCKLGTSTGNIPSVPNLP